MIRKNIAFLFIVLLLLITYCDKKDIGEKYKFSLKVTTSPIMSISTTSAVGGGDIINNDKISIISKGICWDTNHNPTILLSTKAENGSGDEPFVDTLTNLLSNTKYYVRAYASSLIETYYGQEVSFTTSDIIFFGKRFYVSPTGNDTSSGTIDFPWLTWQYAFNKLSPGDILYVRGGTYVNMYGAYGGNYYGVRIPSVRSGTESKPITVTAYQNEIPILDCVKLVSTNSAMTAGIMVECSYWNFIGLSVTNVTEGTNHPAYGTANGWGIDGDYLIFNKCNSYHNGGGFAGGGDYVYFINCDAYENNDVYANGDYANGFSCNVGAGNHMFFEGCRAWANCDDGYDMYGGSQIVVFNNCWAFENGYWNGYTGNGAGFKTGRVLTQTSGVVRTITNCLSFNNHGIGGIGVGFDESQDDYYESSVAHNIFNNTSYGNSDAFNFGYAGGYTDVIRNNISYNENVGSLGNNTVDHNSWQDGLVVNDSDFVSVNSTGVKGQRESDGSLPKLTFLHLSDKSKLIGIGVNVGLLKDANGVLWRDPPSLGAYEH